MKVNIQQLHQLYCILYSLQALAGHIKLGRGPDLVPGLEFDTPALDDVNSLSAMLGGHHGAQESALGGLESGQREMYLLVLSPG